MFNRISLLVLLALLTNITGCGNSIEEASRLEPNNAPGVNDDSAKTYRNETVAIDILANDSDPDGDPLKFVSFTDASIGSVTQTTLDSSILLVYTPNLNASGLDSFTYTVSDKYNNQSTANVDVEISGWNESKQLGNGKDIDLSVSANGQAAAVWADGASIIANEFHLGDG